MQTFCTSFSACGRELTYGSGDNGTGTFSTLEWFRDTDLMLAYRCTARAPEPQTGP